MTKLDEMNHAAREVGLYVRTYGPGDGQTRYRFFEVRSNYCNCFDEVPATERTVAYKRFHMFHYHAAPDYTARTAGACSDKGCTCKAFDPQIEISDYFGPESGIYTALGRKEALTFLRGRGARI